MKYKTLNTDNQIPLIGLGTWKAAPGEVYTAIRWALKLGYNHFDCAPIYGNQKEIGQAFHDAMEEDNLRRQDIFITSKLWNDSHQAKDVLPALHKTLEELQVEYLDLWLMHWPVAQKPGTAIPSGSDDMLSLKDVPLEETWAEMEKAYNQGLVKAIGTSNFGSEKLQLILDKGQISPAVNQVECHPYLQQNELLDFCNKNMIALTAYSPLGSGSRSKDGNAESNNKSALLEDAVILNIAHKLNVSAAQVILAWQMQRGVIVIPKSANEARLQENLNSLNLILDNQDMEQIARLDKGYRVIDGKAFAYGDYTPEEIFA